MKKVVIIGLLIGAIYLGTRKTETKTVETPSLQSQKDFIMSMAANDSVESQKNLLNLLNEKFSVQQINDVYAFMLAMKNKTEISEQLKAAIQTISLKYNIFT